MVKAEQNSSTHCSFHQQTFSYAIEHVKQNLKQNLKQNFSRHNQHLFVRKKETKTNPKTEPSLIN